MKAWIEATKGERQASNPPHNRGHRRMAKGNKGVHTLNIIQRGEASPANRSPHTQENLQGEINQLCVN